jgi:hypothetical protein
MWCDPFLDTAEVFVDMLDSDQLAESWDHPSVLDRMKVGHLAGHTARAVLTLNSYLDHPVDGDPVDAVAYILTVSEDDDISSPLNRQIRERATRESEPGRDALAERTMRALTQLRLRLPELDPTTVIGVFGEMPIRIDEYVDTRLLELVVHMDDLAASLDHDPPDVSDEALQIVSALLTTVADVKHGPWAVIRAFTRRERMLSWPGVF